MVEIQLAKKINSQEEQSEEGITETYNKKEVKEPYEVFIVGSGPAGYTAGIYSARYNLKTIIVGEEQGGQMNIEYEVENYPGFRKIKGRELMEKIDAHARDLGVEVVLDKVEGVEQIEEYLFKITTMFSIYYSRAVILALGTKRRKLNIPGEDKFTAKGAGNTRVTGLRHKGYDPKIWVFEL